MTKLSRFFSSFSIDILGFSGFCMLFYGLFIYSKPLAFCINGAILLLLGIAGAMLRARSSHNRDS